MAGWLDRIYPHCPVWAQGLGVAAFGVVWRRRRMGGDFPGLVEEFAARDGWDAGRWADYQAERLGRLLAHCYEHVPHYRRGWSALGLSAGDLRRFRPGDLPRLPFTSKDDLRRDPGGFVADGVRPRSLHTYLTSGSTGTPVAIKMTSATHRAVFAAQEARVRRWAGVDHTMSRAMIGGRMVVPRAAAAPPYWRYNPAEKQLYLSAFHVGPAQAPAYAGALNRYRPDFLVGYASAHYFLARLFEEAGLEVHSPRAVLTGSEKLTPEMRAVIGRVYRCEVFDGYGCVESCCMAAECAGHRLHVSPDVGVVEIVDDGGRPVGPGEVGSVVATGLLNDAQPLVRYRTGDLASWSDRPCPCGRALPVIEELVGRLEDTVTGPDGRETVRFHGVFLGLPGVKEAQIVQESLDLIRVRVVAPGGLSAADREAVVGRLRARLGEVSVAVEAVGAIERTERGKYRAVISKVPRGAAARRPPGRFSGAPR